MISRFASKSFTECHAIYNRSSNPATRVAALATMMSKAATKTELEIVRDLAHPKSITHAQANEKLELLDQNK